MTSSVITLEDLNNAKVINFEELSPEGKQQFIRDIDTEGATYNISLQEERDKSENEEMRRQRGELLPNYRNRLSSALPESPHLQQNNTASKKDKNMELGAVDRQKEREERSQDTMNTDSGNSQIMQFLQDMKTENKVMIAELIQTMNIKIDNVETNFNKTCDLMKEEANITVKRLETEIHEVNVKMDQNNLKVMTDIADVRKEVCAIVNKLENEPMNNGNNNNIEVISNRIRHNELATNALIQAKVLYNGEYTCVLHPMEFLKRVEEKFRQYSIHEMYKLDIVARCLVKDASQWFHQQSVETYEKFREIFVKKFWNNIHQSRFVRYIYSGKYDPNLGSMVKYTETLMHNAKYIEDILPLSEKHLVAIVMEHLPYRVKNTGRHVTTAEGLIEYLIQIDDEEKIADENRSRRLARDNQANNPRNNNGNHVNRHLHERLHAVDNHQQNVEPNVNNHNGQFRQENFNRPAR